MVEEFAVKYPYLFNYTTEVERKALCEACEDDEDTLMEWEDIRNLFCLKTRPEGFLNYFVWIL